MTERSTATIVLWVHAVNGHVFSFSNNYTFKNESLTVQISFLNMLYGISHGFDITYDLLVMT